MAVIKELSYSLRFQLNIDQDVDWKKRTLDQGGFLQSFYFDNRYALTNTLLLHYKRILKTILDSTRQELIQFTLQEFQPYLEALLLAYDSFDLIFELDENKYLKIRVSKLRQQKTNTMIYYQELAPLCKLELHHISWKNDYPWETIFAAAMKNDHRKNAKRERKLPS